MYYGLRSSLGLEIIGDNSLYRFSNERQRDAWVLADSSHRQPLEADNPLVQQTVIAVEHGVLFWALATDNDLWESIEV